eukprot:TRINITY_DN9075_c0_g1_i2.p1 TRINITY_DN9075_c0_g1~~TRINITY_DN9075_c0_g1_i2.p1  ORF type:complete len:236 (-),score=88.55 TRINITY_DN9075_c0_g1_i2:172-879(-)
MEDDDDYMSSSFLQSARNEDQLRDLNKRKRRLPEKIKPLKELEKEKREEGLNTALDENNVGFKMLKMMGYKNGSSIGKPENDGRIVPIEIHLKSGRAGLGIEENKRRRTEEENTRKIEQSQEKLSTFTQRLSNNYLEKQQQSKLIELLKTVRNLDITNDIDWSRFYKKESEYDEEEKKRFGYVFERDQFKQFDFEEKRYQLLQYLREEHNYCFYCAMRFDDMDRSCPGFTEEDHE